MTSVFVPNIDEQFVSDAWNTLDHPITARDIAEMWVDQNATGTMTAVSFSRAVDEVAKQVAYYLPESGEAK